MALSAFKYCCNGLVGHRLPSIDNTFAICLLSTNHLIARSNMTSTMAEIGNRLAPFSTLLMHSKRLVVFIPYRKLPSYASDHFLLSIRHNHLYVRTFVD